MARIRFLFVLTVFVLGLLVAVPGAQTLSSQVLQLLARINTWTAAQTFQDLRLGLGSPSDTNYRLYNISGSLYWNGALVVAGGGGGAVHNILSATHGDATVASVTRGGLITGQGGVPSWTLLTVGVAGTFLRSDGTDVSWGTDGSALTALNASALASGVVPLARISALTNAQIDAAAGIVWTKLDKAGSSLADLTTRSAADLTSGTLADARLSANVSLFGTSVQTAEILDATILFADWADNSCTSGQYPQYNGSAWICSTVTPGSGTVTSVGLTLPAIFSVAGSPVTGSGTLAATLASQTANLVWAGPSSGGAAAPTFRSLVYNDFPTSAAAAGTYPKVTINNKGIVTGTASQITLTTDVTGTLPLANGGTNLNAAADDSVLLSTGVAWAAASLSTCTNGLTYDTATNTFGCASGGAAHSLLSATHTDTLAASVSRGDLIVGSAVPQWNRLALGASGRFLRSNGSDVVWVDGSSVGLPQGDLYVNGVDTYNASGSNTNAGYLSTFVGALDFGMRFNGNVWISGMGRGGTSDAALFIQATATDTVGSGRSAHALVSQNEMLRNSSGTHPLYTAGLFRFGSVGGTATVTTAATLYVENAPTFAGSNYGLLVDAGVSRFDDGMVERGRTQLVGEWTTPTFAAGVFTAGGAMTWTVDAGDVLGFAYSEIGKTQKLNFTISTTTLGGVANPELRVTVPNSRTIATTTSGSCLGLNNAGTRWDGFYQATAGNTYVSIYKENAAAANWTLETNLMQIRCDMTLIIQ